MRSDFSDNLVPTKFSYNAYPNPFNPEINIYYELPSKELVSLSIFNLLGQHVVNLVENNIQDLGKYSYRWDGKNINGVSVKSGIYFAVIKTQNRREILKITYLK